MVAAPGQPSRTVIPEAVSPREAAVLLGLHRQTVYALIERGELYAERYGSQWRIPLPIRRPPAKPEAA